MNSHEAIVEEWLVNNIEEFHESPILYLLHLSERITYVLENYLEGSTCQSHALRGETIQQILYNKKLIDRLRYVINED